MRLVAAATVLLLATASTLSAQPEIVRADADLESGVITALGHGFGTSNGRAVLMSTDAGATWTDVTGDVGGESMHPDQHALAFVPGNPSQFFVGSDGGVIRTSGQWADASSQCDSRSLPDALTLADCKAWLKQIPAKLETVNAGLGTLQMNSISVSPYKPENTAMTGTQDNGTLAFTGSNTWILPLTGDGGNSGFDATDPHFRFHTYTGGQMDVNYNDFDPNTWLFIGEMASATGFAAYSWMLHNIVYVVANGFTLLSSVIGFVVLLRNRRRAARERA